MVRVVLMTVTAIVLVTPPIGAGSSHAVESLQSALASTASGRALLSDLEASCGTPAAIGLELFVAELEVRVSILTGQLVDGSDPALLEAADSLRKVPRRIRNESLASVIVLLDEWSANTTDYRLGQRATDVMRKQSWSKRRDDHESQIAERFPILEPMARQILHSVGVLVVGANRRSNISQQSAGFIRQPIRIAVNLQSVDTSSFLKTTGFIAKGGRINDRNRGGL